MNKYKQNLYYNICSNTIAQYYHISCRRVYTTISNHQKGDQINFGMRDAYDIVQKYEIVNYGWILITIS